MRQRPKIGEILVKAGVIDEMQLRAALGDQASWGRRLGVTLVKMGLLEERDLVRALAQQLQIPVVQLDGKRVQQQVLDLVPAEVAERHMCVPLFVKEQNGVKTLYVGMDDPNNLEAIDDLSFRTGLRVQPVLVSPSELCEAMDRFYHRGDRELELNDRERSGMAGEETEQRVNAAVQESLFREVVDFEQTDAEPETGEESGPTQQGEVTEPGPVVDKRSDDPSRTILRALCQELIEKGVIDGSDLQARVRRLERKRSPS